MSQDAQKTSQGNDETPAHRFGLGEIPAAIAVSDDPNRAERNARQSRLSSTFINVLAVLMRDPSFRNMRLSDLQWLVIPPVLTGQCRLGQTAMPTKLALAQPGGGKLLPVAVALWARVSDAIDARLAGSLDKLVDLRPAEWNTGENYWLMAVAGDPRAVPAFLGQLEARDFKDKNMKLRTRGPDNRMEVVTISAYRQRLAERGSETPQ